MTRGTFANIRIRNQLAPGTEGGVTRHLPDGEADEHLRRRHASTRAKNVPLVILAGAEYGTGSSRDWAAKGTMLLGRPRRVGVELRAHPSQQPGRHGRACRCSFSPAKPGNRSGLTGEEVFDIPVDEKLCSRAARLRDGAIGRWLVEEVRRQSADRYAGRARLLPQRRHSADGAAEVAEEWVRGRGNTDCASARLGARAKRLNVDAKRNDCPV